MNILALGTGASYGIANVLLSKLEVNDDYRGLNMSNILDYLSFNVSKANDNVFNFMINSDEASWIGIKSNILKQNRIQHYFFK